MFDPSRIDDDYEIRQRNHGYWKDELDVSLVAETRNTDKVKK